MYIRRDVANVSDDVTYHTQKHHIRVRDEVQHSG